jgi:hypothetical protein
MNWEGELSGLPRCAMIVVAHPDDEVLFFLATIRRLVRCGARVVVACAASTFKTPSMSLVRMQEFNASCKALSVEGRMLGLKDLRDIPFDRSELRVALKRLSNKLKPSVVYTHSPWGDYGHVHHSNVSVATHEIWGCRVLSLAGPLQATDLIVECSHADRALKERHMLRTYASQAFASLWGSSVEHFASLGPTVVRYLANVRAGTYDYESEPDKDGATMSIARQVALGFSSLSGRLPSELEHIPERVWAPRLQPFWHDLTSLVGVSCASFVSGSI